MLDQGFKESAMTAYSPNKYAAANNLFAPYEYSKQDGGLWVKTYATFEKLNLNKGLNVGNNAYGTIVGADFGLKELKHGWKFMPTAYVGYSGANQHWNGNNASQNGAQLGFLGTWSKKDFLLGALAYSGFYGNRMETMRGADETLNYHAGAAIKSAYNWKFAKNWALQPNLLVSYNFFGKENWNTAFGQMGMTAGTLHGWNIAPGLNLIYERDTFSVYGTVQYMYNVNQSVDGKAGNIALQDIKMDRGYIQYGVGVNKQFNDDFSGYLQTVIRNAGRTGVSLQAGFNWILGEKVETENVVKEKNPTKKETKMEIKNVKKAEKRAKKEAKKDIKKEKKSEQKATNKIKEYVKWQNMTTYTPNVNK